MSNELAIDDTSFYKGERLYLSTLHLRRSRAVQQLREAFPWDETPRYLIRD